MAYPWTYEEKLLAWRRAWVRVCREQMEQNERDADRVCRMTDRQIMAQAIAEYGSEALVDRVAARTARVIQEAIQRVRPTRH